LAKRRIGDMHSAGRRTTPEVLKEILSVAPATKSSIRFIVGLNYSQAKRYLPYLTTEGYLQIGADEKGRSVYEISPRGKKLLEVLNQLSAMVDSPVEKPAAEGW
jgi:predicted transcriptional regulator